MAWRRVLWLVLVAVFVVATNLAAALSFFPRSWYWAPLAAASLILLFLWIRSEVLRDSERRFVTEPHRQDLHKEAARVWDVVAHDQDCAPSTSSIGRSFTAHFPQTARLLGEWHRACEQNRLALAAVETQSAADAPGMNELVQAVILGQYKLDEFNWSVKEFEQEGHARVELKPNPTTDYFFPVVVSRHEAEQQRERVSAALESIPTWPSVVWCAATLASCGRI
jgi:hypothetical protein